MRLGKFLIITALSFAIASAKAQDIHIVTPKDAVLINETRHIMDSIRQYRPTVGLVLSGGGAKGAAHIGVLEYLESIDMPVDMVLGTSMGGLVGGIYALGYPVSQLDSIVRNIDWSMALSDRVPPEYVSYSEKKYKERYMISFPFYYGKDADEIKRKKKKKVSDVVPEAFDRDDVQRHDGKLEIGADSEGPGKLLRENLLGSLPSGYIFGQNVQNIFSSLSVGYQDSLNFNNLPIPFACVATELVSGKAKVWHDGKITLALRSTMSIPGIFAPVKTDSMVLVDGGMRDNYPTTLARTMGADIIIGVDVSSGSRGYDKINNLGDIVNAGIDMLGRSVYEENLKIPDINIKPNLDGYTMMSFDTESIDSIIQSGYKAACDNEEKLLQIKELLGEDAVVKRRKQAININVDSVYVSDIEIRGVSGRERAILMEKIEIDPGDRVSSRDVENAVAAVFGTQAYDYVTYEMEGKEEPFRLVINCKPGPVHHFGVGLRFDTEEVVSVLLNVGLNTHKLQGSRYDFTGKISTNPYFKFHYTYTAPKSPTLNAVASVKWTGLNLYDFTTNKFKLNYLNTRQEIYVSNINWSLFDMRFGIRNEFYDLRSFLSSTNITGDYDMDMTRNDYVSLFLTARADTFDDGYFPTKGFTAGVAYDWTFAGFPYKINNFHALHFGAKVVVPAQRIFAFIPSINFRFLFGKEVPLPYMNCVGGSIPGRYIDQQVPFIGLNKIAVTGNILTVFRADFRFNLAKNHYLTGIVNYLRDCESFKDYVDGPGSFGAGLEYSYDTIFGPVSADIHWSSITRKPGFYIGIGYYF